MLNYISLLIHENTNCFFCEKENPQISSYFIAFSFLIDSLGINYTTVQSSTLKLVADVKEIIENAISEQLLLDILKVSSVMHLKIAISVVL